MTAVASVFTCKEMATPRSSQRDRNPKPYVVPLAIPDSSASPEDKATVDCVTLQCFKRYGPKVKVPPEVLRRFCASGKVRVDIQCDIQIIGVVIGGFVFCVVVCVVAGIVIDEVVPIDEPGSPSQLPREPFECDDI